MRGLSLLWALGLLEHLWLIDSAAIQESVRDEWAKESHATLTAHILQSTTSHDILRACAAVTVPPTTKRVFLTCTRLAHISFCVCNYLFVFLYMQIASLEEREKNESLSKTSPGTVDLQIRPFNVRMCDDMCAVQCMQIGWCWRKTNVPDLDQPLNVYHPVYRSDRN